MPIFWKTRSYLTGWLTKDRENKLNEHHRSEKGKRLSVQVIKLENFATDLCSTYDESWCLNESRCWRKGKHLPFQCDCNENETLASYARGYYDFDKLEQIEEFFVFMGAYEITALLKNRDEAPYKSDTFALLGYCLEYYNDNPYIAEFLEERHPRKEETVVLQEPVEEETIAETESSLDEKEEESDEQK